MFARIASAILSGSFITLSLFWVMNQLIAMQPGVVGEPRDPWHFTFLPQMEDQPVVIDEPPTIIDDLVPSETPPERPNTAPPIDTVTVPVPPPTPPQNGATGITGVVADGPLVNMMRALPVYPVRAQEQGLEGYVVVQFDVLADGTVSNVSVVESSHRVFERSAIDAASRFRFKARVVDGIPQASYGIRNQFTFEMDAG